MFASFYAAPTFGRMAETSRQGPHHVAQKSTSTGTLDLSTSASQVASVTSSTFPAARIETVDERETAAGLCVCMHVSEREREERRNESVLVGFRCCYKMLCRVIHVHIDYPSSSIYIETEIKYF